jgi:hypothetical protein
MLAPRPLLEEIQVHVKGKLLGCCFWGSQVYGTSSATSDWDVMCVVDSMDDATCAFDQTYSQIANLKPRDAVLAKSHARTRAKVVFTSFGEVTLISSDAWARGMYEHRIEMLEGLLAPPEFVLVPFFALDNSWKLDIDLLGMAVEWEAGRTLARARRKIKEGTDMRKARKELFHAFRYLIFGCQIADAGKISDFAAANSWWKEIRFMSEMVSFFVKKKFVSFCCRDCDESLLDVDKHWLPKYKELFRSFRAACGNHSEQVMYLCFFFVCAFFQTSHN